LATIAPREQRTFEAHEE